MPSPEGPVSDNVGSSVERLDVGQLGRLVRERRGQQSLRRAAADAGVSFSTLARVEDGHHPDLASFTKLCAWLGLPPSRFFSPVTSRAVEPLEEALLHLRADPRLTDDASEAIGSVLKQMYERLASEPARTAPLVACHLRAAPVMRPGVPQRLGSLLSDLHDELERQVARGVL